ncbi:MAG TPA: hypothetical protein VJH94_03065 [Candidatus Paceibacterota bacterium]
MNKLFVIVWLLLWPPAWIGTMVLFNHFVVSPLEVTQPSREIITYFMAVIGILTCAATVGFLAKNQKKS